MIKFMAIVHFPAQPSTLPAPPHPTTSPRSPPHSPPHLLTPHASSSRISRSSIQGRHRRAQGRVVRRDAPRAVAAGAGAAGAGAGAVREGPARQKGVPVRLLGKVQPGCGGVVCILVNVDKMKRGGIEPPACTYQPTDRTPPGSSLPCNHPPPPSSSSPSHRCDPRGR